MWHYPGPSDAFDPEAHDGPKETCPICTKAKPEAEPDSKEIEVGQLVHVSHGLTYLYGVVIETYGNRAVIRLIDNDGDTLAVNQSEVTPCPELPPFVSGHGRPDLDMLHYVESAIRNGHETPVEILFTLRHYLIHRPSDIPTEGTT